MSGQSEGAQAMDDVSVTVWYSRVLPPDFACWRSRTLKCHSSAIPKQCFKQCACQDTAVKNTDAK